jgi:hypothetical protein
MSMPAFKSGLVSSGTVIPVPQNSQTDTAVLFVCNAGLCCDAWTIELVTELAFEATVVLTAQFVVLTVINLGFPDRCFLKPLRFSSEQRQAQQLCLIMLYKENKCLSMIYNVKCQIDSFIIIFYGGQGKHRRGTKGAL